MNALTQVLALCRPGFENECAAELTSRSAELGLASYIKTSDGSGYVQLLSADNSDISQMITDVDFTELVFVRDWYAGAATQVTLPEKNRTAALVPAIQALCNYLGSNLHDVNLVYADTNTGKSMHRFCKSFKPHLIEALKTESLVSKRSALRLNLFFQDSTQAWIGVSHIDNCAIDPMGIPRLRMPTSAPSRSTLKLEEAITRFFDSDEQSRLFAPGMRAVDLGAAPGGWSWQLVKRGLLVTAVDNGPMDEQLMDSGLVEHLRTDAFTYVPDNNVDWLVCDMAERPLHVTRLIAEWISQRRCQHSIFNLKLPMKKRYQAVEECRALIHNRLSNAGIKHRLLFKQLYHDREEITGCVVTGKFVNSNLD